MTKKAEERRRKGVVLCFLLCLILTGYPLGANWLFERRQDLVLAGYEEEADSWQEERRKDEWEKAAAYNRRLSAGTEETEEKVRNYEDCLNLNGDGMIGFLEIPKLQLKLPIYHGVTEKVLQKGLGHLPQTSLPIGQEGAHAGITGHSGLSDKRLFSDLEQLEEGDRFKLYVMDRTLSYRVERIESVLPTQTEELEPEEGKDYVTLITCTPYGINDHRLLVRGVREEEEEVRGKGEVGGEEGAVRSGPVSSAWKARYRKSVVGGLLLSGALVALYLLIRWIPKRRSSRAKRRREGA